VLRLVEDVRAIRAKDPAARGTREILLCYPGLHALAWHRLAHRLWRWRVPLLPRLLSHLTRFFTGIEIHPGASIGRRVFIDHGMGVVIGETAAVGDDCLIYQGVTLGGTSLSRGKRHPTLEEHVVVGSGAKVLGNITLGHHTRVGSGSVVVKSAPPRSTIVGIPGRALEEGEEDGRIEHRNRGFGRVREGGRASRLRSPPRRPDRERRADGAVAVGLALGAEREEVRDEESRDGLLVAVMDVARAVDPGDRLPHGSFALADDERDAVDQQDDVHPLGLAAGGELVLGGDDAVVPLGVIEVEEPDPPALDLHEEKAEGSCSESSGPSMDGLGRVNELYKAYKEKNRKSENSDRSSTENGKAPGGGDNAPGGNSQRTARPAKTIPSSLRKKVLKRDGHKCQAPGCGRTCFLRVHHIEPEAAGGATEEQNLCTVCDRCHDSVHEERLSVAGKAPHQLVWRDGSGQLL